jgi:hypothetical protein
VIHHFLSAYAGFAVVFRTAHRHAPNAPKAKLAANRGKTAQNGTFGKSNRVQQDTSLSLQKTIEDNIYMGDNE